MKKISKEELINYRLKEKRGHESKVQHIYAELAKLLIDESLLIEKSEWPLKVRPNGSSIPKTLRLVPYAKYTTQALVDDSGWVVTRTA